MRNRRRAKHISGRTQDGDAIKQNFTFLQLSAKAGTGITVHLLMFLSYEYDSCAHANNEARRINCVLEIHVPR